MPVDRDDILRQVQGHLQSLREAGVEWLPSPPTSAPPTVTAEATAPGATSGGLFVEEAPPAAPAAAPAASPEERRQALQLLAQEVASCCRCAELASTRTQTVFGRGGMGVDLCFVGEAPGADED